MHLAPSIFWCCSYLVGSIPTGLLIGFMRGVDLREHGSHNIGATNAARVLGRTWAVLVFVLDFAKGFLPVFVAEPWMRTAGANTDGVALIGGLAAVLGHVFPVYLRFKGGKGVATAAGVFAGLAPFALGIGLLVWIGTLLTVRWVALASLLAAWTLPLACYWLHRGPWTRSSAGVMAASVAVGLLITIRHRSNIRRMLRGEEPKIGRRESLKSLT